MNTNIDLHRFDAQVADIEKQLERQAPEKGGILFYGSSTMGNWRANNMCYEQMAPLPIVNTGFGGSTAEEALYFYHRLVVPAQPSVMVYYEGANDISNGYTAEEVIETSHRLFEWMRQDFPGIRFVIMPIKLCLGLKKIEAEATRCNELFKEYAEQNDDTSYLNVDSLLYDGEGNYRTDVYVEDMLHHTPAGYVELAALVKPVLTEMFSA